DFHVTGVQTCALPISCGKRMLTCTVTERPLPESFRRPACCCAGRPERSTVTLTVGLPPRPELWLTFSQLASEVSVQEPLAVTLRSEERRGGTEGGARG